METIKRWIIRIGKGGKPFLLYEDNKYGTARIVELESKDVIFRQEGFEFSQIGKQGKPEMFECLYENLDTEQPVAPLSKLPYEVSDKQHSLLFLYEILSGVALRAKPVVKVEALDVDKLLEKYASLSKQLDRVDFHKVVEFLNEHFRKAS